MTFEYLAGLVLALFGAAMFVGYGIHYELIGAVCIIEVIAGVGLMVYGLD